MKVSLHTVGRSPEPVLKSIKAVKPDAVYLVHTHETEGEAKKIIDEYHLHQAKKTLENISPTFYSIIVHRTNPENMYRHVPAVFSQYGLDAAYFIDLTSGTNKMVAALAMLAFKHRNEGYRIEVQFIDFEKFDNLTNLPVSGSEVIVQLSFP
jgi:hypothetical protein